MSPTEWHNYQQLISTVIFLILLTGLVVGIISAFTHYWFVVNVLYPKKPEHSLLRTDIDLSDCIDLYSLKSEAMMEGVKIGLIIIFVFCILTIIASNYVPTLWV